MADLEAVQIAQSARLAYSSSLLLPSSSRTSTLHLLASALSSPSTKSLILSANAQDVSIARQASPPLPESLIKRLDLTSSESKYNDMVQGVRDVAGLEDPCGRVTYARELDEGLELYRVTCPIGVLLVIFEARPEVIVNIASLAIKSGNAAILKGGKESLHTQNALTQVIQTTLRSSPLPETYIQTVTTRSSISSLLSLPTHIDLVIPRGSNALVRTIQSSTQIPVMGHADGLCCAFVDASADPVKTVRVVLDGKCSYPAACNALEQLVLHEDVLGRGGVWEVLARALLERGVELRCDERSLGALKQAPAFAEGEEVPSDSDRDATLYTRFKGHIIPSTPEDLTTEHLSLTLTVLVLPTLSSAIAHIDLYSSSHTDIILTEDPLSATQFTASVSSAGVFVNASSRFADGFRYGFGTEVGIATGRVHARGPVGLEGLCIYKYQIRGEGGRGWTSEEFGEGEGRRKYKHRVLQGEEVRPLVPAGTEGQAQAQAQAQAGADETEGKA